MPGGYLELIEFFSSFSRQTCAYISILCYTINSYVYDEIVNTIRCRAQVNEGSEKILLSFRLREIPYRKIRLLNVK